MVRSIRDLIDQLEDLAQEFGDDAEVRFAHQPRWAFEYSIAEIGGVKARRAKGRREATPACIYLAEGSQIGYLPQEAAVAIGWADAREEDEEEDDDDMPGLAGGSGPDHDTRDREGAEEPPDLDQSDSGAADPDPLAEDFPGQRISGPADAPLCCEAIERSRSGHQPTERRCTRRPHGPELAHAFGSWCISDSEPRRRRSKGGR